jgi:hypothetical protein
MALTLLGCAGMVSPTHELLVELFHSSPALITAVLHAASEPTWAPDVPVDARVLPMSATLSDLMLAEYHADLVLQRMHPDGDRPAHIFIIEAQLAPDEDKRFIWPLYAAGARARGRCPVTLVVLALDQRTARWSAEVVILDPLGTHVFRPIVIGPGDLPAITDVDEARARPALALLSALIHSRTPGGEHIVRAALLGACPQLDSRLRVLYADLLRTLLSDEVRSALEELMHFHGNSLDSHFARYYYDQGEKAGREALRALLIKLLTERFGAVPEAALTRIQAADAEQLARWGERVLSAASLDDVLADAA